MEEARVRASIGVRRFKQITDTTCLHPVLSIVVLSHRTGKSAITKQVL